MSKIEYGLILANDKIDEEESLKISEDVAPHFDAIKIGITTTLKPGTNIFRKTKEKTGKILIADFKVADIGFQKEGKWQGTNNKIVREAVTSGADYVICHTIVGTSSIQECVDTAHEHGGKVLTLPYMTHKGADVFFDLPFPAKHAQLKLKPLSGFENAFDKIIALDLEKSVRRDYEEFDWRLPYASVSDAILLMGEAVGVDGYIGPANNPAVLKDYRKLTQKPVLTPGIGRQSEKSLKEQFKDVYGLLGEDSATILGSLVYKAEDPGKTADEVRQTRDEVVKNLR